MYAIVCSTNSIDNTV